MDRAPGTHCIIVIKRVVKCNRVPVIHLLFSSVFLHKHSSKPKYFYVKLGTNISYVS